MRAVPMELKDANAYIEANHRHHGKVCGDKFRVACEKDGEIVGVVMVGRPVARCLCDGKTLEVVRLCTNGDKNVCSFLYAKAARIAKELGYKGAYMEYAEQTSIYEISHLRQAAVEQNIE